MTLELWKQFATNTLFSCFDLAELHDENKGEGGSSAYRVAGNLLESSKNRPNLANSYRPSSIQENFK